MQTEKPFLFVVAAWQQNSRYPKLKWQCKVYPGFSLFNLRVACNFLFFRIHVHPFSIYWLWRYFGWSSHSRACGCERWWWASMGILWSTGRGSGRGCRHSCRALSRMTECDDQSWKFSWKWMNHTMQFRALPTKKGDVKAWIEILAQTQPNLLRLVASTWDNLVDTLGTL